VAVKINPSGYIDIEERAAPGSPSTNVGRLYVADDGGTTKLYFKDSSGTVTAIAAATVHTGLSAVSFAAGSAGTISLAANGAADDLTISVTGAYDSSIILSSAGTGEDAIKLAASAGGVDIDALAAKDIDIAGGQVKLVSKDNAAGAISLTANVGTSETILVTNTQGTSAAAINLTATAGGITLSSSAGLATGDPITGDGTAALKGFLQTVTDDNNGKTLSITESGTVQTNLGASGAAAWTLPAAAAGLTYTFVVMAAQELRVTPAAGDVINIAGVTGDAAEYWTANAIGESLTLVAVDGTNWIATSMLGTWTQQTP
jgi:hypothetical protein